MKKLFFAALCIMLFTGCDAVDKAVLDAAGSMEHNEQTAEPPTEPYTYDLSAVEAQMKAQQEQLKQNMSGNMPNINMPERTGDAAADLENAKNAVVPGYSDAAAQAQKEQDALDAVRNYQDKQYK